MSKGFARSELFGLFLFTGEVSSGEYDEHMCALHTSMSTEKGIFLGGRKVSSSAGSTWERAYAGIILDNDVRLTYGVSLVLTLFFTLPRLMFPIPSPFSHFICSFFLDDIERRRPFSGNDNEIKRGEWGVVEAIIQIVKWQ